jgi:hypothetical protein
MGTTDAPAVAKRPPLHARPSVREAATKRATPDEPLTNEISGPERSAYGEAHAAQFVQHDPAAALRAWDVYLSNFPRGTFVLEARFNRAISLARLGRRQEARSALEPFASGSFGGYRQAEARTLLEALTELQAH